MQVINRQSDQSLPEQIQFNEKQMKYFFDVLKATVVRQRTTMTACFVAIQNLENIHKEAQQKTVKEFTEYLKTKIRQTDLLLKLEKTFEWCILLPQSGEEETKAFLGRLYSDMKKENEMIIGASVAEIGNDKVTYEQLMEEGHASLLKSIKQGAWHIEYIADFKQKDAELVKVSILEENEIFSNVLKASLEGLAIDHFNLTVNVFKDGYAFLESGFYQSGHTHIVIMNDILPRKNGLEVLHTIRQLPNNKKFTIFMMTKKKSEADMLYAYEKGVDEYLVKPFNLRLFEAQIKRTFERYWS